MRALALLGALLLLARCACGTCTVNTDCAGNTVCAQDPVDSACKPEVGWPCSGHDCACPTHCVQRCDAGCGTCATRLSVVDIGDNYDKVHTEPASVCLTGP